METLEQATHAAIEKAISKAERDIQAILLRLEDDCMLLLDHAEIDMRPLARRAVSLGLRGHQRL